MTGAILLHGLDCTRTMGTLPVAEHLRPVPACGAASAPALIFLRSGSIERRDRAPGCGNFRVEQAEPEEVYAAAVAGEA